MSNGKWSAVYVAFLLFFLALGPRIAGLSIFLTKDENTWLGGRTQRSVLALLNADWGATYQKHHPGVTTMWAAGLGLWAKYALSRSALSFGDFVAGMPTHPLRMDFVAVERVPIVLISAVTIVLIYLLCRKIFAGQGLLAFLCAVLAAFDPYYVAHSRLGLPDGLAAHFMLLSFLSFVVYLRAEREGKRAWSWLILSGGAAGLAVLSKLPALSLGPTLLLCLFLVEKRKVSDLRGWLWPLLAWAGVAVVVFTLLWPAMWADPLNTVRRTLAGLRGDALVFIHRQLFLGRLIETPGLLFYPVILLCRMTPLTMLGVAALGLKGLFYGFGRRKAEMTMLGLYVFVYLFFVSASVNKADRFVLPVSPALDILAALGLWNLTRWEKSERRQFHLPSFSSSSSRFSPPVLYGAACLILQAGFCLPYWPYYLSYYNPALGGGLQATRWTEVGLGEGLDEAANYLNNLENSATLRAGASYPDSVFSSFFVGQTKTLSRRRFFWDGYDYVVLYVARLQQQSIDPAIARFFRDQKPEHVTHSEGIDYAWVYRVPDPLPRALLPYHYPAEVSFGEAISLLGYDLNPKDSTVGIDLYWLLSQRQDYILHLKVVNGVYHVWGEQKSRLSCQADSRQDGCQGLVMGNRRTVDILPGTPPGSYQVAVYLYDPHHERWLEPQNGAEALLGSVEVPRREPPSPESLDIEHPVEVDLDSRVRLLGYSLESGFRPGDDIHLTLFWQALTRMEESYTVFTHLVDGEGRLWGQKDNRPVDDFYPTTNWQTGEIVRDQYNIVIDPEAPPGQYTVEVGMYLPASGERLRWGEGEGEDKMVIEVWVRG
jgi:hypothetical protein